MVVVWLRPGDMCENPELVPVSHYHHRQGLKPKAVFKLTKSLIFYISKLVTTAAM